MKQSTSIALAVVGVIALGAAWQFGVRSNAPAQMEAAAGSLVFPGLASKLGQVARLEISTKGQTLALTPKDGKWGLTDRAGFPVQSDKLRELLTGLTELRFTEPRTSDPAQYARLGVEDPGTTTGTASLLKLLDSAGKPIAELIVGHRRVRTQGNVPETIFIRRPGETQSWLAEGRLPVDADPQLWFERDIANIPAAKITQVLSTRGDTTLEFVRDGDKIVLKSPVDHPKLDDYRVEEVARALDSLTLTDVQPATKQAGEKIGNAIIDLTDGMQVTADVYRNDKDIWVQFAATGKGDGAKPAADFAAKTKGWTYQVGAWKEKAFVPTLDDLKASEPDKPATEEAPATE